jgi:hypothetical protein
MYIQKVISGKTFFFNLYVVGVLKVNDENSKIRKLVIGMDPRFRIIGSTPKCHGSETLTKTTGIEVCIMFTTPKKIADKVSLLTDKELLLNISVGQFNGKQTNA